MLKWVRAIEGCTGFRIQNFLVIKIKNVVCVKHLRYKIVYLLI